MPTNYPPLTRDQEVRIAHRTAGEFHEILVRLAAAVGGDEAPLFVEVIHYESGQEDVVAITRTTIVHARGTAVDVLPLTALWKLEAAHVLQDSATSVRGPRWTLHVRGLPGDCVTLPSSEHEWLPDEVDELLRQALVTD